MKKFVILICYILISSFLISACGVVKEDEQYELMKETSHFMFYCDEEEDMSQVKEIAYNLEAFYDKITMDFYTNLSSKVKVTVYPTVELFKQNFKDAPDWLVASKYKNELKMVSPSVSEEYYDRGNINLQLKVGLGEIVLGKINKKMPYYLMYAISSYESDKINFGRAVEKNLKNGTFPTIKQLNEMNEENSEDLVSYYISLVEFIVDKYGINKLVEFAEKPNIKKIFEISEEEFENQWVEYTKSIYDVQFDINNETEHFIFHYMEQDKEIMDKVSQRLEEVYGIITNDLKAEPISKVEVKMYPKVDIFEKQCVHDMYGIDFASGYVIGEDYNIVKILSSNAPGASIYTDEGLCELAVHEFVHTVINAINKDVPSYVDEGIATYLFKEDFSHIKEVVSSSLKSDVFPTIAQLKQVISNDAKTNGIYEYGCAFVQYIVEEYGYDTLVEYIKTPDIQTVFGMSEGEFEKDWIEFLQNKYY